MRAPEHVHLLFLPPHAPELQPAERLWLLTDTALVNRHFARIEELEDSQAERCVALQERCFFSEQSQEVHEDSVGNGAQSAWWLCCVINSSMPRGASSRKMAIRFPFDSAVAAALRGNAAAS